MRTTEGPVTQTAHAKVNLTLHVTGQRDDGYHLLDSLVMFTELGDVVTVSPADTLTLTINGPFAADLPVDDDNLVLKAARAFGIDRGASISLTKNLPLASGVGGGSADAAATLHALAKLWDVPLPDITAQLALGADVPVCMRPELTHMQGIGERITRLGDAPPLSMLLINPGVAVSTPTAFNGLADKSNTPMTAPMPMTSDWDGWNDWLAHQRNDLEGPACAAQPVISQVLEDLGQAKGCHLTRMSGSGATCFGLFKDRNDALNAQHDIADQHPDWWVRTSGEAGA